MRLRGVLIHIALTALVLWSMPIVPSAVQAPLEPLASATTRMVGVDGVEIRARTMGLGTRKPGQPAVVFEGGASAPLETWDTVLAGVAGFAPVVTYDRAGTGQSSWDGLPPTPERVGTRLQPAEFGVHLERSVILAPTLVPGPTPDGRGPYSVRSATTGEMRVARRTGAYVAAMPQPARSSATPA